MPKVTDNCMMNKCTMNQRDKPSNVFLAKKIWLLWGSTPGSQNQELPSCSEEISLLCIPVPGNKLSRISLATSPNLQQIIRWSWFTVSIPSPDPPKKISPKYWNLRQYFNLSLFQTATAPFSKLWKYKSSVQEISTQQIFCYKPCRIWSRHQTLQAIVPYIEMRHPVEQTLTDNTH